MVLNIIGFLLIYNIVKNTNKRGVGTICYFIWYGIVRGILEFTRMDAVVTNSGFPVTQFFSFLASGIGIIIVFLIYKGKLSFGYSRRMLTTRETDPTYSNFELNRKDFTKKTVALPKEPVPAKNNKNKGK